MKTILLQLKKQLTFITLLFISVGTFAQTLVNYPLDNNLNANAGPDASITPVSLQYYDPPSTTPSATTNHAFGYLNYRNSGDYLQFNFNLPANDNVTLQVNAGTAVFLSAISGNIQIYTQIGTAPETLQQQNLNASSSLFSWFDSDNISFSLPISNPQASAVPVKIRIVGNITSTSGLQVDYFGIGNISLVREITSISVRGTKTPAPSFITHNAGASVTYDTDFGSLLTNEESLDKTYRITNTGSRTLKINSIQLDPNNVDFSIFGAVPTTINTGQSATFTVRFAPTDQGLKTAEVVIAGNITPDNPFRFEVKGNGKSCNLTPVPIAQYGFEGAAPSNMPVSTVSGTIRVVGGTATNPAPNIGTLNPSGNLYSPSSPNKSWYVRGNDTGTVTLEFGPVDVTNQQEVSINFDLAAFGLTSDTTSGVNSLDYIILSVYNPTTSAWSQEIRLNGSNTSTRIKYAYGASSLVTGAYDGNNTAIVFNNNIPNNTNYGSFKLNIPPSITQLRYRITAFASRLSSGSNRDRNLWLIDNVHVDAGNAKVKTWTGTGWIGENTNRPDVSGREKVVFAGNYNFTASGETADLSVCECEVNAGVNLNIPTGKFLSVRNKIINHDPTGNNFVVESDANLLQEENGIVNSDNITAKRIIKVGAARNQYNYLGTPVNFASGETFKTIYPGTTFVLYHNETNNMFYNSSGVNIPGRGLAVKEPTGSGATNVTATYKGVPQNGKILFPVANKDANPAVTTFGYNLVGNPYPSNINLLKLYEINGGKTGASPIASPNISPTFYFWDNNGNGQFTQQGNGYLGQAYAIFNVLSGTTGTGTKSSLGTKVPTSIVKVGQGFMTRTLLSNYDFVFNNSIRTNATSAADFLGKGNSNVQDDRYWLQFTAPSGITSTIAVVHYASGNNAFGPEDSRSMGGSDAIYTMVENEKIAIEGRSSFANTDRISLGTKHFATGNYTIGLDDKEGIFANGQSIYLKDLQTGIITNLSDGNYTFQANAGESTGRFEIIYKPESVLATNQTVKESVIVYRDGTDFIVKAENKKITALEVYDSVGRLIYSAKPNAVKVTVPTDRMLNGVYLLKIDQGGTVTTKKVIR